MLSKRRLAIAPALALVVAVGGCSFVTGPDSSAAGGASATATRGPAPSIIGADGGPVRATPGTGTLGPGFVTPSAPPPPGGTMTPSPTSWSDVTVPAGYTIALLSTDDSAPARHLATAVRQWAKTNKVTVTAVPAHHPATYVAAIQKAIDLHPDLVVSTGDPLADPLALVTASWIDQKFLLLGAELAEPTANVTAAVWRGTTARGGADTGNAWAYDPSTFTVARAERALDAGVAAVLQGYAGYVVQVS